MLDTLQIANLPIAWILAALAGLLIFLVGGAAAAGAMLPEKHKTTRAARYRKRAADLFAIVAGPSDWRPEVRKYELLPPANGRPRFRETSARDGAMIYEVVESRPPRRLVTRIADDSLAFGGSWTFELLGDAEYTELRITEDGEIHNVLYRFLARFVFGHATSIERYLKALGKKVGEDVKVQA